MAVPPRPRFVPPLGPVSTDLSRSFPVWKPFRRRSSVAGRSSNLHPSLPGPAGCRGSIPRFVTASRPGDSAAAGDEMVSQSRRGRDMPHHAWPPRQSDVTLRDLPRGRRQSGLRRQPAMPGTFRTITAGLPFRRPSRCRHPAVETVAWRSYLPAHGLNRGIFPR